MRIRSVLASELGVIQEIERAAGVLFRGVGMVEVAEDEPLSVEVLEGYRRAGWAWVGCNPEDRPVGYLVAEPVDGALHVEQVSVHYGAARRGVGRALLTYAQERAREEGLGGLTLTTFAQVPWNAPYYERLGFRVLGEDQITPGLRAIHAREAELGLDRWPRVCMRRDIS
ncbi:GNAT family N-acetyltransferase [Streptomyces nigra]|uniref:GNAT family N-acetyltransferase n=1 Tax=Streptomyces nigra TaxID=1827580 RepID=A0ABZ1J3N3_9ACTN